MATTSGRKQFFGITLGWVFGLLCGATIAAVSPLWFYLSVGLIVVVPIGVGIFVGRIVARQRYWPGPVLPLTAVVLVVGSLAAWTAPGIVRREVLARRARAAVPVLTGATETDVHVNLGDSESGARVYLDYRTGRDSTAVLFSYDEVLRGEGWEPGPDRWRESSWFGTPHWYARGASHLAVQVERLSDTGGTYSVIVIP